MLKSVVYCFCCHIVASFLTSPIISSDLIALTLKNTCKELVGGSVSLWPGKGGSWLTPGAHPGATAAQGPSC